MNFKLFISCIIIVTSCVVAKAQLYILPNEISIFSFQTKNGKLVHLNRDKQNKYIVYRFGTKNKIEFQYPEDLSNSWKDFKYSFYFRPGGVQNEGLDIDHVTFRNNNFEYVIYSIYYSRGNEREIGIEVTNFKTKKTTDIKGVLKTRQGSLASFRENNLLIIDNKKFYD